MEPIAEKINEARCKKCERTYDVSHVEIFTLATCPSCGTKNTAPGKVDDLMLVEIIGAGGMGVVYRAVDMMLHREVAVKVMKPMPGGKFAAGIQGSLQEARAQARINHPNVAQIHSIIWYGEQPFIVMELIAGGTVHKLITKDPPMDEARALKIGIDVARGLEAAWKAKLVFGDVKPANILLSDEGAAKLSDFGLSRMARGTLDGGEAMGGSSIAEDSSMNSTVPATGTASYVAPEVAKNKIPDFRADMYSLGVTMYHMLAGDVPFQGENKRAKIMARMNGVVPQVAVARPGVGARTNAVVAKMMAFYPDMRHASYAELIGDLERALTVLQGEVLVSALSAGVAQPVQPEVEMEPVQVEVKKKSEPSVLGDQPLGLAARMFAGAAGAINRAIGAEKPKPVAEEPKLGALRRYDPDSAAHSRKKR